MKDKLIVTGLGKRLDGEYEFSLVEILGMGQPDSLTMRELHRIKTMTELRAGEIEEAFFAEDSDLFAALAVVLMTRAGKVVDEEAMWDAQPASLTWDFAALREDEESPPAEPAETPAQEKPSTSGGKSSVLTLASPENGQSRTGLPGSVMSVTSSQAASAT